MSPAPRLSSTPELARTLAVALLGLACSKVPVTGRHQYNLVPDKLMIPLGESTYKELLSGESLEKRTEDHKRVKTVGKAIAAVTREDYEWRYSLIKDDETINAWCLPGGKIAVYTGILPVLQSEAGLSFVMGHEIGHAIAHHGAERLSQQITVLGGLGALYLYMDKKTELSDEQQATILAALGVGATVGVILPFSRKHEQEADIIGVMYMARAGYPPDESIALWDRMEEATGGSSVPTFLSTHPSDARRQANITDWLGRANKRYQRSDKAADSTARVW